MTDLIEGSPVILGGKEYIVPALTLKRIKKFQPVLVKASKLDIDALDANMLDKLVEIIHAAISRNYPEMTVDDLSDMLDMRNLPQLVSAAIGASATKKGGPVQATPVP